MSPFARLAALLLAASAATLGASAQTPRITVAYATPVVDPKLPGGAARFAFHLEPGAAAVAATLEVRSGGQPIAQPWSGVLEGGAVRLVAWDGRDANGERCPTGSYTVHVSATGATPVQLPLEIVRLGVTEIEAQESAAGGDEFPMVYFRKGSTYSYYATPQIHEYANLAPPGEVSDLDLDDGEPRPAVAVHTATDSPVLDGSGNYEQSTYNYPLAYVMGAAPRLELTFGAQGTAADGTPMPAGYPVAGFDLRAVVSAGGAEAATGPLTAGGTALVDLGGLPAEVRRTELKLGLRWQVAPQGTGDWQDVPGRSAIPLRLYTLLGPPVWTAGATGVRYAGPWVEVVEYVSSWKETLAYPSHDEKALTELFVRGFFGQNGGLPEAIEGVVYDAFPLGGDGGATHYFDWTGWKMDLSRLLNKHAKGVFVNCTDNMGATTTMLSMLGVPNVRPVRLGPMTLKAIWGIGAPDYTTDLWGTGDHRFSYHHIVTDDDGEHVTDTCMQLDQDGSPQNTPGYPGWNDQRKWKGGVIGYDSLSSYNHPDQTLETLPGIK